MKIWANQDGFGIENLKEIERPEPKVGAGEIIVDMKAASLNYRDLLTVMGKTENKLPLVPFSDGAGVVKEVGSGVSRVKVGDRVCSVFFQSWLSGPVTAEARSKPLGGPLEGVLQQRMKLNAEGVLKIPEYLSFEEAATLPCAGLTAWRAIAVEAPVSPGDTVLVQGTGGVSIFALQFAKARGAKVIATSSSDEKLERVKQLGADHGINYKSNPEWEKETLKITDGRGVDVVVEVGGDDTMSKSLEAVRVGGAIIVIGVLGGFTNNIFIPALFSKNARMIGISIGSREQFEEMMKPMADWKMHPVVDKVFPVEKVQDALKLMQAGRHFGKICLKF
jgi:NADPH:quinone reductase-like Zn-dependent oxidoreductase